MKMDLSKEIRETCEAVLSCQRGLEEIEKYISRLSAYTGELGQKLEEADMENALQGYSQRLTAMQAQSERLIKVMRNIREGQRGIGQQTKQIARLDYTVNSFERAMADFGSRMDSLSQRLYNKDFRNAMKAMETLEADLKRHVAYEYLHPTDNDLQIMQDEYVKSLAACRQKGLIKKYLEASAALLCGAKLRLDEREALERLVTKMAHSDTKSLKEFIEMLS